MAAIPEAKGCFVLIIQGSLPWAGVMEGIDGVREALVRFFWTDPERALIKDVAAAIASLDDPAAWAPHGSGDGHPFWHWWLGYEGGSVTVQRLTDLPTGLAGEPLRSALKEATHALTDLAEDLRRLAGADGSQYVFARRGPDEASPSHIS